MTGVQTCALPISRSEIVLLCSDLGPLGILEADHRGIQDLDLQDIQGHVRLLISEIAPLGLSGVDQGLQVILDGAHQAL